MPYIKTLKSASDLVTSREETRAGFIAFAIEKNRRSTPYIESAKSFKKMASEAKKPDDLLNMPNIRVPILTASGLSDKALNYFNESDQTEAISELIDKFLKPAGKSFVEELVYRYLLIKGDSLGGSMRNVVGSLGQQKLIRTLLSNMSVKSTDYVWLDGKTNSWFKKPDDDYNIEVTMKAISWETDTKSRTLAFNLKIPLVNKNVDLCLFSCNSKNYNCGKIVSQADKIIMLGELKAGIDPAGADEHWKTGNSALERIRSSFRQANIPIKTSFVGAAIENAMAKEIFEQLQKGIMDNAANLSNSDQLIDYCNWLLNI